jgi:DNA replication protein DnaC
MVGKQPNFWASKGAGADGALNPPSPKNSCPDCGGKGTQRFAQRVHYDRSTFPPTLVIDEEIPIPFNLAPFQFFDQYGRHGYREAAANCHCLQAQITERRAARLGRSEMPDDAENFTLNDFKIYPEAYEFARMMINGDPLIDANEVQRAGLLFVGPYGGGKSVLSSVIFNKRQKELNGEAIWLKLVTMVKRFQETYSPSYSGPTLAELIDQLCSCPLLVIDELGNRNEAQNGLQMSRDRNENLLRVIDYRTMRQLPTIFTSNLDLDQLYSHLDPAIASRIRGLCHVVVMDNPIDFRTGEPTR